MKIIKSLAIAAGIAALTACGGGAEEDNAANVDANLTTDMNMDMNMPADNMTLEANNVTVVNEGGNATDNATGNAADNTAANTL